MPLLRPLTHHTLIQVRCIIFQVSSWSKQLIVLFGSFLTVYNVDRVQALLKSCEFSSIMLFVVFQAIIFHLKWNPKQCFFLIWVGWKNWDIQGSIKPLRLLELFVEFSFHHYFLGLMVNWFFCIFFEPFVNICQSQLHGIVDERFIKGGILKGISIKIKSKLFFLIFCIENFSFLL